MINFFSSKITIKKEKKIIFAKVNKVLDSGNFILGKEVNEFEKNFSKYIGTKYGVGVGNCTDAIYICLKALDISKGHEVITVPNTAIPTINAILNSGASPVFVDIGKDYLIDADKIEKSITKKTRAIIPVHLYGQTCNMEKIIKIAKKFKLKIIEDCAQSTGSSINKKKSGSFGDFGCFSFYPTKVLPCIGDGGFITTNNKSLYDRIKKIRYMGIDTNKDSKSKYKNKYYASMNGVNSRLDEIQAAILNLRLKKINNYIKKRLSNANLYFRLLKKTEINLPRNIKKFQDVFYEFVVCSSKREKIINYLKKHRVNLKITYPFLVNKMPPFKYYALDKSFKNAEKLSKKIFSLPIYPYLSKKEIVYICKKIKEVI